MTTRTATPVRESLETSPIDLEVLVIPTETANIASVLSGLRRAGARARLLEPGDAVETAPAVVLPGVGAFAAAMVRLHERGLVEPLRRRIRRGDPTLAICLGLQLLCESSEESPAMEGLGVAAAPVERFTGALTVPHMGWNRVVAEETVMLRTGYAYFANSYRVTRAPEGWHPAWTEYGGRFVSAFEREGVLACQFHPELSGPWGQGLLRRWLMTAVKGVA